jgi:hypothetical protein
MRSNAHRLFCRLVSERVVTPDFDFRAIHRGLFLWNRGHWHPPTAGMGRLLADARALDLACSDHRLIG